MQSCIEFFLVPHFTTTCVRRYTGLMSRLLALDLGKRRTGAAYGDDATQIVIALDTIHHTSASQLIDAVEHIAKSRRIERLIIGLPLLLDGSEGEQARWTKKIGSMLEKRLAIPITYVDERFSSLTHEKNVPSDADARAACIILNTEMEQTARERKKRC